MITVHGLLLVTVLAAAQADVLAIVGGQIVDGTGAPPIENGVVVVEANAIRAVGPRSEVAVPPGARIVDAGGPASFPASPISIRIPRTSS
jgi:imidazolonepropionase-like amidohydrolase